MKAMIVPTLTALLLSIFSFSIENVGANIVDMGSFNLPTNVLINKYDFSYGDADGEDDLDQAAIRFDLKFVPQNTHANETYALLIIAADSDSSSELVYRLRNGTQQPTDAEHGVERTHIHYIEDVEDIIDPMLKNFTVY